jgi:hypothetical protein
MALYVVVGENPYFRRGTYVEEVVDPSEYDPDFEVDVPEQMVQRVEMVSRDGVYQPGPNKGFAIPLHLVRHALLRIQKQGVDKTW